MAAIALTRQLHKVVEVNVLESHHHASVIASILRTHMRDLEFYPAIVFSDCDSSFQWITGEPSAVQQNVAPSVGQFTAGLVVTVVKWMEGQPQHDGLIGLHPLLPLQKLKVWNTKIIITQAVLCSGLKRKVADAPYLKETEEIKASSSLWWSMRFLTNFYCIFMILKFLFKKEEVQMFCYCIC